VSTDVRHPAAAGWVVFAGFMLLVIGAFDIIQGIVALLKREVYVVGDNGLIITNSFNAWGWSLLIWGIILLLAGLSLFAGGGFGRWFAIIVVVINLIGQFAWFPAYPLWSLIVILLSVAVLWALTAGWRDARAELR
jgi:hypothetical protein